MIDTRECGWLGCGRPECEPVCTGQPIGAPEQLDNNPTDKEDSTP